MEVETDCNSHIYFKLNYSIELRGCFSDNDDMKTSLCEWK